MLCAEIKVHFNETMWSWEVAEKKSHGRQIFRNLQVYISVDNP